MPKYYPTRRYSGVAEIKRGDVVRMRHDDETHGSYSPAFDDFIVVSVNAETAKLARPMAWLCKGEVKTSCEQMAIEPSRIVKHFHVLTRGLSGEIDNRIYENRYSVRFVHQISPRETDTAPPVELPLRTFDNPRTLGAALRDAGLLPTGGRVTDFRYESGSYTIFPQVPGMTTFWHAIVLTFIEEPRRLPVS